MIFSTLRPYLFKSLILISIVLSLLILSIWLRLSDDDPQGIGDLGCDVVSIKSVENDSGWIASGHETLCSGFGGNSAIYVYVHRTGQKDGRESLVFRYFESQNSSDPKIVWTGPNKLMILVDEVSQITKMLSSIGPVEITYKIQHENYPRK